MYNVLDNEGLRNYYASRVSSGSSIPIPGNGMGVGMVGLTRLSQLRTIQGQQG